METFYVHVDRWVDPWVLSLPMRNGNYAKLLVPGTGHEVLSLPMRNGNREHIICLFPPLPVLSLPMRNGNSGSQQTAHHRYHRS